MKELSIEEKAKRYDEAIKKAESLYKAAEHMSGCNVIIETLFPELKESEDERIRKELVDFIYDKTDTYELREKSNSWLAWLEKQGSEPNWCHHNVDLSNCSEEYRKAYYDGWNNCNMQHSQCRSELDDVLKCLINGMKFYYEDNKEATWGTDKWSMPVKHIIEVLEKQGEHAKFRDHIQVGDKVTRNEDGVLVNLSQLKRVAKPAKKQGKRKPIYKAEPKFKAGDWVVSNEYPNCGNSLMRIVKVGLTDYLCRYYNGQTTYCREFIDKNYHLWTIQDAKDGDVLFTSSTASHETFIFKNIDEKGNAKCYFAYDSEDGFREGKYHFIGRATDCKPATKEQRDLLFQKMKEAGYEWNADKKELKKIEQKSAWSEEDDKKAERIIRLLQEAYDINCIKGSIEWLKSLKDRVQPKQEWSEEDRKMLYNIIHRLEQLDHYWNRSTDEKMIDWLKSLRPQSQWKPTEWQLKQLGKYCPDNTALTALYEQLKKLREE